jgi:hypothetical protein
MSTANRATANSFSTSKPHTAQHSAALHSCADPLPIPCCVLCAVCVVPVDRLAKAGATSGETVAVVEKRHAPSDAEAVFTSLDAAGNALVASTWLGRLLVWDGVGTLTGEKKPNRSVTAHGETVHDDGSRVVALGGGVIASIGGPGEVKLWRMT